MRTSLRTPLFLIVSCLVVTACAVDPNADSSPVRDRQLTTGSNIPRKGQATTVDKDSITDSMIRSGGTRTGGS